MARSRRRAWAGPNLLATSLFETFRQHQPLNRQVECHDREGAPIGLSTLPDLVGACAAALAPLHDRIAAHVPAAERLHGADAPVPAKGRTDAGRLGVYVRDDRAFAGGASPGELFRYARDRRGEQPVLPGPDRRHVDLRRAALPFRTISQSLLLCFDASR